MVVRPHAGSAFIRAARRPRRRIGRVNRPTVGSVEAHRDPIADARRLLVERPHDPELRPPACGAIADRLVGISGKRGQPERGERCVIEALGLLDIVRSDSDVTEHGRAPPIIAKWK